MGWSQRIPSEARNDARTDIEAAGRLRIDAVKYRALGPITVEVDDGEAKLGGLRQQMVLAVLLSRANQVVSQDSLIDAVWAGEPPEAARATLQSYIYNLRRSLGPDAILRRGDGYLVTVDTETFDVLAFEDRVERGSRLIEADPDAARAVLLDGLGMWFGMPYGGVDHSELHASIQRLGEMRVNAIETRIQADLALGRDGELIGELESLVREYPLRERFWGQLMLALYRSGRQAEALRTYQKARTRLVSDLGIEPGAELRELEERILAQDPTLIAAPAPAGDGGDPTESSRTGDDSSEGSDPPRAIRGYELREVIGVGNLGVIHRAYQPAIGREVVVKVIRPQYANDAQFVARFEREAQIVANLEHPHILQLHDYWRDLNGAYLVMPLMRGGSMDESLRSGGWSLEPALRLLDQVGRALAYAHRRGVLHGGLTPHNILLDDEGNAYLSDFGIGLRTTEAAESTSSPRPLLPPELVDGEHPTIRSDIFALGALTFHVLAGVPLLDTTPLPDLAEARPDIPEALGAVVAKATASDPGKRFGRVPDFLRELRRAAGVDVVAGSEVGEVVAEPTRNPYKGLRAFGEEDSVDFHGRANLIEELLHQVSEHRLVTVVGPSGSGKSSLVRAGLIPALRAGGLLGSRDWLVTDMFPGTYPFEELEAALSRVAVRGPSGLMSELTESNGLLRVSKQILPGDDSTLLLVIDQFEELFSTVPSEVTRRRFLDNLLAVASDERGRIRVITTIRADFLDRPLAYGDFAEALAPGLVTIGPPTRDGLAQAVAGPARAVGLELEPGLVDRIIGDIEGQPGALPLLQYALTEMFTFREGATLTAAAYEATGGVTAALGQRAEELYEGLTPAGKAVSRDVFLRLVSVDELGAVTRRRARQKDLLSLAVDRAGLESVVSAYAGFRLLSFDRDPVTRGPTVEVAHEALLTEWPRLRGWIDDARESLVFSRRIGESAQEWIDSSHDPSYLLRGARLEDTEDWASHGGVGLTSDEMEYIAASVDNRSSEVAATRRRRRRTIVVLALGLMLVSLLAVAAFAQREAAREEARVATVRELASGSSGHLEENPELALLIAAEAFDEAMTGGATEPMMEASSAIARAIADWRLISRFAAGGLSAPVASPDGSLVATSLGDAPADIVVFDSDGSSMMTLEGPDDPGVFALTSVFHPDERTIAVGYASFEGPLYVPAPEGVLDVAVFDIETGRAVSRFDVDEGAFALSFDSSGDLLAVSGTSGVRVVDWVEGAERSRFDSSFAVGRAVFLDDDRLLLPIERQGLATFSIGDGEIVDEIEITEMTTITSVDTSQTRIAYRAGERLEVMDIVSEEVLYEVEAPGAQAVALSPDGALLAYSGFDPNIYVVDVEGGTTDLRLAGTLENVLFLSFVGQARLMSSGEDVLVWDVSPEAVEELAGIPLTQPQWGFQVSADDRMLTYFVATNQGTLMADPVDGLRVFDLAVGTETRVQEGELFTIETGIRHVSPDFSLFGSLNQDGTSSVRRLLSWEVVRQFEECRSPLVITPDNSRVLVSGWSCLSEPPPDAAVESDLIALDSGESSFSLPYRSIYSAAFNPEGAFEAGRYLVFTDQQTLEVRDTTTGELLGSLDRTYREEWGFIMNLAFDPTGRFVVGGTTGGSVWVMDLERVVAGDAIDDSLVFTRQAHAGAAPVPAINGDGVVATVGFDGVVRLWELETGDLIFEFEADVGIPVVIFSPDGSELLYPYGLSIRRMPVDPMALRELAGELLTRDFLPDECSRYSQTPCEQETG